MEIPVEHFRPMTRVGNAAVCGFERHRSTHHVCRISQDRPGLLRRVDIPDALDRLKCAGLGYVTFALRRPEHLTVMFDAPKSKRRHPDSPVAGEPAFGTLMSFVKGCQDAGRLPSGDLRRIALLA